jgi:hypothetical protein
MTEQYYRSPIDKLVVESGMTATLIAQYMQIKYHRMVALRRMKDVEDKDIELCKQAITKIIDDKVSYRRGNIPVDFKQIIEPESNDLTKTQKIALHKNESLCYLVGQMTELTDSIFDYVSRVTKPSDPQIIRLLYKRNKLIEQFDRLLIVN